MRKEITMIRRIIKLTIIFIFVASASSLAKPVNLEVAQKVGVVHLKAQEQFFIKNLSLAPKSFSKRDGFSILSSQALRDSEGRTLAYIFDLTPEGFIVVSPDTDIHPVIAYSFKGRFPIEESPDNVLLHLVTWDMEKRLEALSLINQRVKRRNNALWEEYTREDVSLIKRLSSTTQWGPWLKTDKWDQSSPYNKFCPMDPNDSDKRCIVGCVALSMAQIIEYWKYPNSVSFTEADKYTSDTKEDPGDQKGRRIIRIDDAYETLDFPSFTGLNQMLSDIKYQGNADEIAALCFACGVSVKMNYSSVASGTWPSEDAYKNKFRYAKAEKVETKKAPGDFYDVLQRNMKNRQPAQLAIFKKVGGEETEGHAIVADGFKESGEYHLVFGWGGSFNAWCFLPQGMSAEYNVVDHGIVNIYPFKPEPLSKDTAYNYPNPFNPDKGATNIRFSVEKDSDVIIEIFDVAGDLIWKRELKAGPGETSVSWDGKNEKGDKVANGVYIYQVRTNGKSVVKKIVVLR